MKIRAFLAFDIPEDVKKRLSNIIADFQGKEKGVRWVSQDRMHVTLKFFGGVEEDLLLGDISARVESAVSGYGASKLTCQGIGVFPNWKYPRVFWAGFAGETEKVMNLQKGIEVALSSFDLHEDERGFRVHLTLGRVRGRLKNSPITDLAEKLGPVEFGTVVVDKLILYKSVLTKNGPVYTPLKEFKL